MLHHSTDRNILSRQLDALEESVGWEPRGDWWTTNLRQSTAIRSAWDGARIVGFIRGERYEGEFLGYDLMVAPAYRGAGIGRTLLESLVADAKRMGCTQFKFYVTMSPLPGMPQPDPRALTLYRHLGFDREGSEYSKDL